MLAGPCCLSVEAAETQLTFPQVNDADQSEPGGSTSGEVTGSSGPALDVPIGEVQLERRGVSALPDELSPIGMFRDADIVVKVVMIGLIFASVVTWTIALAKSLELVSVIRKARRGRRRLAESVTLDRSLAKFGDGSQSEAIGSLVRAAMEEIQLSPHSMDGDASGLKERVRSRLERGEIAAARQVSRGTGVLATIGSTAPFVGLFGTVWGIMNSFIGISKAQTTNLAVVAPGIAEALLATALGLIAAIPAVIIYNMLARRTATYRALLGDASAEILRQVSRDTERVAPLPRVAAE